MHHQKLTYPWPKDDNYQYQMRYNCQKSRRHKSCNLHLCRQSLKIGNQKASLPTRFKSDNNLSRNKHKIKNLTVSETKYINLLNHGDKMKLAGDQKLQNTVYFRFLPCPILFGGHELFSGTQSGTLTLLRLIKKRSVLIPQDTLGHPRTPQDVQICIINMLFW